MIRATWLRIALALIPLALAAAPAAMGHSEPRPTPCSDDGALVAYYVGDDWWSNNSLVIHPDGRTELCWARMSPVDRSDGHASFFLPPKTLTALKSELQRIGVQRLGSQPADWPPCCDRPFTSLAYKGKAIPRDGSPTAAGRIQALDRAEAILRGIVRRNTPD